MKKSGKFLLIFNFLFIFYFYSFAFDQNPKKSQNSCFPLFPSDELIDWECYKLKKEETPENLFGKNYEAALRFNRIDQRHIWPEKYLKVPRNFESIKNFTPLPKNLDKAKEHPKYVFISTEEQFLGAYEFGELKFSMPITSGRRGYFMPKGLFKALGRDKNHRSSLYKIEKTNIPYPMFWGVKFHVSKNGTAFWIHGRDLPGYPDSHGCIGLYDEEMQKKYYGFPKEPKFNDAKKFYFWLFPESENDEKPMNFPENSPIIPIEII